MFGKLFKMENLFQKPIKDIWHLNDKCHRFEISFDSSFEKHVFYRISKLFSSFKKLPTIFDVSVAFTVFFG